MDHLISPKHHDFVTSVFDSSFEDNNSYDFFDNKNKNIDNNFSVFSEKKLFEIEIKQNNNYNKNIELLHSSQNYKNKKK